MRASMRTGAFCLAILFIASSASGQQSRRPTMMDRPVPGMSQAQRHNPFSSNYTDMTPGGYSRRHSHGGSGGSSGGSIHSGGTTFYFGDVYPGYGSPWHYGYDPYFDPFYGSGYGSGPYYDPYSFYPPPLFIPPETMYGPQAVLRMLYGSSVGMAAGPVEPRLDLTRIADADVPRQRPPSNATTRARAWRFIDAGDELFRQQKYFNATQRYRSAIAAAFDVAEAHFHQGQALLAAGRHADAARAFKRGLEQDPDWPRSQFKLDRLYGDDEAAKIAHLDALAAESLKHPNDSDLLFLIGIQLYFGGDRDRSDQYFAEAQEQVELDDSHLQPFLNALKDRREFQAQQAGREF